MAKKRLVVQCATGIRNSGDEAILAALISRYSPRYHITVISLDKKYTETVHSVDEVVSHRGSDWKRAVRECDVFLLGGGGLIQEHSSLFNVFRWTSKLQYAGRLGKKCCVYANSIGRIRFPFNRYLIRKAFSRVAFVTLRDALSQKHLGELGITRNVFVTADVVFSLDFPELPLSTHEGVPLDLSQDYVALAIRHCFDSIPLLPARLSSRLKIQSSDQKARYERFVAEMARTVEYVRVLGYPVLFIPFYGQRDVRLAREVCARLADQAGVFIYHRPDASPAIHADLIRRSRLLIGMRLHSVVFAVMTGTPVLPVIYHDKVRGIVDMLGLQDQSEHVSQIDSNRLRSIVDRLLADSDTRRREDLLARARSCEQANDELFKEFVGSQ